MVPTAPAIWRLSTALGGYHRERRARVGMQLFHDAADIVLDSAFGQEKRVGNLPVAHALGDEPQNLLFLFIERLSRGGALLLGVRRVRHVLGRTREAAELIHDLACDLRG